jgi:asparagine N-glycosylation enzyme membrane subunit Stt3
MKRLLSLAAILGAILRIVPYWTSIFSGGYINFASADSYYQIDLIIKAYALFPTVTHLPEGTSIYHVMIAGIGWILSWGHGDAHFIEEVAAFLPIVFFILTVPLVYFIARELFSPRAGIIAASVFALLPGEYLTRSILGEIDYHAFEVLLTTGMVVLIIWGIKRRQETKNRIIYWLPLFIVITLIFYVYFDVWRGAVIFLPVLFGFLIPFHKKLGIFAITLSTILLVTVAVRAGISLQTIFTTSETQPGIYVIFIAIHLFLVALMVMPLITYCKHWPLVIWSGIMFYATFFQLRFDYYLIVPLAILSGMTVDILWVQRKTLATASTLFIALILSGYILLPKPVTPSLAWHTALEWVKTNTPEDSLIVSWWDYGYWIRYLADREAYVTPSQEVDRVKNTAEWFIYGQEPSDLHHNTYLIADPKMIDDFLPAMKIWADDKEIITPFIVRLYFTSNSSYLEVFEQESIVIYKMEE